MLRKPSRSTDILTWAHELVDELRPLLNMRGDGQYIDVDQTGPSVRIRLKLETAAISFDTRLSSRLDGETTINTIKLRRGYRQVIGSNPTLCEPTPSAEEWEFDVIGTGSCYVKFTYTTSSTAGAWSDPAFAVTASVPSDTNAQRVIIFANVTVTDGVAVLTKRLNGDVAVLDVKNCVDCIET